MRTLLRPAATSPALADIALLLSRVALGVILVGHGWQKLREFTLDGTAASFAEMGIPFPSTAATVVTAVELAGGAALILGLLTPVVALLNFLVVLGALVLVHAENGLFVSNGGVELVLALAAGLLVVATLGAGRFSVDGVLGRSTAAADTRTSVTA